MQKYSQAAQVLQQMGEKRKEKRQLSNQLTTIQAKEAKSKSYYKNKQSNCTKSKSVNDTRSDGQKSVEAFFAKSGSTESRNIDACVPKQGSGTCVDPKVVILEDTECHGYSGSSNSEDGQGVVLGSKSCAPSKSTDLKDSEDMVDGLENCVSSPNTDHKDSEVSNGSLVDLASLYSECDEEMAQSSNVSDENNVNSSTTSPPSAKSAVKTFNKSNGADKMADGALEEIISDNETSSRKVDFLCH